MNRNSWIIAGGLSAALSVLLVACGGSVSMTNPASVAAVSNNSQGVSASGMVTAFGSVFVNGKEFMVDNSTAVVDGDADDEAASAAALHVGMDVDVIASGNEASLVRFTSAVRGEVDAIDTTKSTLTVLGQTVDVSSGTAFAGSRTSGTTTTSISGLSDVSVGDYVVVYGYEICTVSTSTSTCTGNGTQVLASLVFEPGMTGVYRTMGYASAVSSSGSSFMINGLTVDVTASGSGATRCVPSPCAIADGDYLEVRGSSAPVQSSSALTLAASVVKTVSRIPVLISGETVTIEGPVANVNSGASSFTVRGVSIDGSALASTVATLSTNEIVEVTGTVTSSNSITATAISVEKQATFSIMAPLTAESATANTLQLLGQTFTVSAATRFDDDSMFVRPFNFSNFATVLSAGDQLIVTGYTGSSGNIATRVTRIRTPAMPIVAVEGVVTADSASAGTLTIGGVVVTLGSMTNLEYPGAGMTPTVAGFVNAVVLGASVVGVEGTPGSNPGTLTAAAARLLAPHCGWAADDD
jgi:Domain of unknown function (DUF5666)